MNTFLGSLPKHLYVLVDTEFTHRESVGFMPAVWFGLTSHPGRMWGCNVMFENGAIYRNLPLHALAHRADAEKNWSKQCAQRWNCYGHDWSATDYVYLRGLYCSTRCASDRFEPGHYLFTVAPVNDAFSEAPDQSKEFTFVKLDNGRFTVQPTDHLLFEDKSFTTHQWIWPKGFKRQTEIYSCE